jgi:hypothetical protein
MTGKKHAKFSASSSERWLNCAASIALSEQAPPSVESKYAVEGTDAHTVLEYTIKKKIADKKYPREMHTHAKDAIKEILKRKLPHAELFAEMKVTLDFIHPEFGGTFDAAIVEHFGRLHVFDYKYGAGVAVDALDNSQMVTYGLGLAHKYDYNFEDACLTIIQPRAFHKKGPVRDWVLSIKELLKWRDKFHRAIELAESPKGKTKFAVGDWCRWCPAKVICPEQTTKALKQAQADFEPAINALTLPDPTKIDLATLGETIQALERLEFWIAEIRAYAFQTLERGGRVDGYKLVPKRGTRKWMDYERARAQARLKFGYEAFSEPELLSPAQLDKLDPEWVAARCTNVSSGMTMVADTDEREPVNQIDMDFKDDIGDKNKISNPKNISKGK